MDIILWHKLLSPYEQAVDEMVQKFRFLKRQYQERGLYCPIEHVIGRVKSISSILEKLQKKNVPIEDLETEIEDIAGIRIICQFVEDISRIADDIACRRDMKVIEVKDYIRNQKDSGYRSYHLVVSYNVETIDGCREVLAEIQIRTMAMDFWATVEHSLQYKYKGRIPEKVSNRLSKAAGAIMSLDDEMSSVREDIMDAQLSSQLRYNLIEDIVLAIEGLYRMTSRREVEKIQEEFYRIYQHGSIEDLKHYHDQLDLIAQAYRAQKNRQREGIKMAVD